MSQGGRPEKQDSSPRTRTRTGERPASMLYIAAILAPLAILVVVGFLSYAQVRSDAELRAGRTAQALSEHALRTFRAHDLIVAAVQGYVRGWSWERIVGSRELHEFQATFVRETGDINTVFIVSPDGRRVNTSIRFPAGAMDLSRRPFFIEPRQKDELHISQPDVGRLNRQAFFSFTRRRPTQDGSFDGIISVSVNPEYFSSFYEQMVETPEDAISLVRADGVVLARTAKLPLGNLPPNIPLRPAMERQEAAGIYSITSALDGNRRIVAFHKVGEYPVYVSFALSYAAIWAAWSRNMLPYAGICLLAAGLLLAAAVLVRRRLRREQLATEQYVEEAARREAAEQASRAKDEFLAALSHELRNPLAALSNASELMRRLHGSEPASRTALDIMGRQMGHLKRLLDDLLDVARINFGKLTLEAKAVELVQMARTVADDLQGAQGPRIAVTGEPVTVAADPARLRQMIENLLDNARKYGGDQIAVSVRRDGGHAELAVSDNGEGIDPELLPRLFEPFVQGRQSLERAKGGLGLGLALVHRLAQLHGGSLLAESSPQGSVFTIRLPLAASQAGAGEALRVGPVTRGRRVMLVEDQQDVRESLEAVLNADGHEVETAAHAREALERLRHFRPEVVLIDIGLPGMDGYGLAREISALPDQDALLIALSGYGQPEDRMRSRQAGFAAHLIKPLVYADLERYLQAPVPER